MSDHPKLQELRNSFEPLANEFRECVNDGGLNTFRISIALFLSDLGMDCRNGASEFLFRKVELHLNKLWRIKELKGKINEISLSLDGTLNTNTLTPTESLSFISRRLKDLDARINTLNNDNVLHIRRQILPIQELERIENQLLGARTSMNDLQKKLDDWNNRSSSIAVQISQNQVTQLQNQYNQLNNQVTNLQQTLANLRTIPAQTHVNRVCRNSDSYQRVNKTDCYICQTKKNAWREGLGAWHSHMNYPSHNDRWSNPYKGFSYKGTTVGETQWDEGYVFGRGNLRFNHDSFADCVRRNPYG